MELTNKTKEDIKQIVENLDESKKYDVKISYHIEKRTLTANAYYWALVSKIANVLQTSKEEVHEKMIKRYSQREYISVLEQVDIEKYGIRYYDEGVNFTQNGKRFKSYIIYENSSDMNKLEFSILVEGIVSEAQEMGIETLTPEQIALLKYHEKEGIIR